MASLAEILMSQHDKEILEYICAHKNERKLGEGAIRSEVGSQKEASDIFQW